MEMYREMSWIFSKIDYQLTSLCALHRSIVHSSFGVQCLMVNAAVKTPRVPIGHEEGTIRNPVSRWINVKREYGKEEKNEAYGSAVANFGRSE